MEFPKHLVNYWPQVQPRFKTNKKPEPNIEHQLPTQIYCTPKFSHFGHAETPIASNAWQFMSERPSSGLRFSHLCYQVKNSSIINTISRASVFWLLFPRKYNELFTELCLDLLVDHRAIRQYRKAMTSERIDRDPSSRWNMKIYLR